MKEKRIIKTDAHKKIEQMSNDVLHLVMCEFIERQRECLGLSDHVDIFITAEKGVMALMFMLKRNLTTQNLKVL